MRKAVLAFDSGAKRAGWALIEVEGGNSYHVASGVEEFPRLSSWPYQEYALKLVDFWSRKTVELMDKYSPHYVITEIVPPFGMNNFAQGYLAHTMATTVQTVACLEGLHFDQVSAVRVQNAIGIKGRGKKVTKPNVRNGVIAMFPKLEKQLRAEKSIYERSDAIAIALYYVEHLKSLGKML